MSKTSRRSSGVLTAKSVFPLGERASGRTWPLSKTVKRRGLAAAGSAPAPAPDGGAAARQTRTANRATRDTPARRTRDGMAIGKPPGKGRCLRCTFEIEAQRIVWCEQRPKYEVPLRETTTKTTPL